ncbi:MAG: endopeptidase La [Clostridia bacterium]|nr:endopeptidase La [Clostridia bacterium]
MEKDKNDLENNEETLPSNEEKVTYTYNLVCLSNTFPYPKIPCNLEVGKESSINAIKDSKKKDENLLYGILVNGTEINEIAVLGKQLNVSGFNSSTVKVNCIGVKRARILNYIQKEPFYRVEVELLEDEIKDNEVVKIYTEKICTLITDMQKRHVNSKLPHINLKDILTESGSPAILCDSIANIMMKDIKKKIEVLNAIDLEERLQKVFDFLVLESKYAELSETLQDRVKANMDKSQKEYFLREQMKALSEELGEDLSEIEKMEESIEKIDFPPEIKNKLKADIKRMRKLPSQSPDNAVLRNYIDTVLNLPWTERTEDNFDLAQARKILDEDHSGLEKIKERIIEYLACMKLTGKISGQIICFAGPPGVGKTSIAKSIARALGRNFVRMSLGGIKDEAEIRGHRKTYIGAMPGRILYNMRLAKVCNPLFLIDEIDKLGSDYKGDPSSAMLEVLDPEQNVAFRDNYLEIPYDLSQVLFIATANDISTIPPALRDRMEIIQLSSYTATEKLKIAKEHLVEKERIKHGLKEGQVEITDDALMKVIEDYTFEAGVRNLEREIATICRKSAVKIIETNKETIKVDTLDLKDMLGAPRKNKDKKRLENEVGTVSGLYYTPLGGGILNIEVSTFKGKGDVKITGQLGDVMKESAQIAMSVMKSHSSNYNINYEEIGQTDIHIHVPEGAIKKDGPSAGIALTTALVSQFSNKPVDCDLAMTGEIGLRGEVLPIGGLKEKLFACVRSGISKAIVPAFNKDDIDELPNEIKDNLKIFYVNTIKEVLDIALV